MSENKAQKLAKKILDKMLEKYNIDTEYVAQNQEIDGIKWYDHYTFTQDEFEEWANWSIKEIRKTMRWNKKRAENEFGYLNLMFGLKIENNV